MDLYHLLLILLPVLSAILFILLCVLDYNTIDRSWVIYIWNKQNFCSLSFLFNLLLFIVWIRHVGWVYVYGTLASGIKIHEIHSTLYDRSSIARLSQHTTRVIKNTWIRFRRDNYL